MKWIKQWKDKCWIIFFCFIAKNTLWSNILINSLRPKHAHCTVESILTYKPLLDFSVSQHIDT